MIGVKYFYQQYKTKKEHPEGCYIEKVQPSSEIKGFHIFKD